MNLFEIASRKAYRFASLKGELTVEQLWQLPLTSRGGTDLDTLAKGIFKDLKATEEESFVSVNTNPRRGDLENKLEIIKHIIKVKQDEAAAATKRQANAQERQKLMELLEKKNDQELEGLSKEDIEKKLAALDD